MTAVTHMCYKHNNKQTKGKCSQLKDWRSVWICTFLRFLCWCQVHLSSYHSIIPFNLANEKWKNSQYLVFLFFKHWKLVFVFLFNGKYNKTRKPVNKEIINLIFILRYCYTMSHGTFLLWGIKVRFVFYVINNTLRKQKQVLFFVFLILGKKNRNHQFGLISCFFVRTDKTDLPLNISFPLVGGPSAPHCLWLASVLYQLHVCCPLQNKGSRACLSL